MEVLTKKERRLMYYDALLQQAYQKKNYYKKVASRYDKTFYMSAYDEYVKEVERYTEIANFIMRRMIQIKCYS